MTVRVTVSIVAYDGTGHDDDWKSLIGNKPFTCIQCTVHTSQSVLAHPPPQAQFNVSLDSGLCVRPLPTLNGGEG